MSVGALPALLPVEAGASAPGLGVEVLRDLPGAEALWRALEAAPEAVATPYQRFDWVAAFLGRGGSEALRVVVVRQDGVPVALLPLLVARRHGIRVATAAGGRHANYAMPLYRSPTAAAALSDLPELLRGVARAAGIDTYDLSAQPVAWNGVQNPLARGGAPSPSDGYGLGLDPDAEATVRRAFSADARKKLRAKEKRLVALLGPVSRKQVTDPAEVERVLAALHAQKAARFGALGIANPFADPAVQSFLRNACRPEGTAPPCGELHALVAEADGRVLATFLGAVDGSRFSGMVNSFDGDAEIARNSPGDLLLMHLVADQAARGRRHFDLGVGEARYKASLCDEVIALRDLHLPASLRGRVHAAATGGAARIKRRIKRDPRLWALVRRLRRFRAQGAVPA